MKGLSEGFSCLHWSLPLPLSEYLLENLTIVIIVLSSHTRDIMKEEIGNVDMIKEKIMAEAKELNVPLQDDDLDVRIEKKMVKVDAHWSEVVDFWGYYQKRLDFTIHEEY